MSDHAPKTSLRRHSKLDDASLTILLRDFCVGLSVRRAAKRTGLSQKTVRSLYLNLRERLLKPKFNKWHRAGMHVFIVRADFEEAVRDAFFEVLSRCYFNATCLRNFTAGNRKSRLCQGCPIPAHLKSAENVPKALKLIDAVHYFYGRLGIRGERTTERVTLFKLRLAHTAVMISVAHNTRKLASGAPDPNNRGFLSFRTLYDRLLADLIDDPL